MGCNACDLVQVNPQISYFLRVGPANVQILACRDHMAELRRIYMLGLYLDQDSNPYEGLAANPPADHAHECEWLDTECPECGIKWRFISPDCPRYIYNRHPLG